jgi:predicted dienelactone hydrolase
MKRFLIWSLATIACLCVFVVVLGAVLDTSTRPVPEATPGYTTFNLQTTHRDVPLPVTIWYPTATQAAPTLLGQNALFHGHYAQVDAAPLNGPLPVVLLSHGSGGNAVRLGWLASQLAMLGFVVASVDHPGTTSGDSDPFQTIKIWEQPADLSAVLDTLAENAPLELEPDMSLVAVLGFSLGGQTALALSGVRYSKDKFIAYCDANADLYDCGWMQAAGVDFTQIDQAAYEAAHFDPRIKVSVAVDPEGGRAITDTASLLTNSMLINLGASGSIPEAMRADDLAAASGTAYLTVPNSTDFSFLAECSTLGEIVMWIAGEEPICTDVNGCDRSSVHSELVGEIGGFLVGALKD